MSPATTEWDDDINPVKPRANRRPPKLAGCLMMTVLTAAILIAMAVFGLQTKVGGDIVASYLKKQTGLDLSVGAAQMGGGAELILTDVQTKPSTTPLGSFKAREIQLGWRWNGDLRLTLRGVRLELVKIADGWVPSVFSRIATLKDVRDTAALFAEDPHLVSLDVVNSSVVWSSPDGERLAAVDGLNLSMRPVILGDRQLKIFDVSARNVFREGGVRGRLMNRMWVATSEQPYLGVEYRGIWEGNETSVKDWWSVPPGSGK